MQVRCLASDFSVALAIVIMSAFDALVGVDTPKLNVPHEFRPTSPTRGWLVPPLAGNPWWTVPLAFPPALLCCVRPPAALLHLAHRTACSSLLAQILLFMDQQITSVIVNRREHKLAVLLMQCILVLYLRALLMCTCACSVCSVLCRRAAATTSTCS